MHTTLLSHMQITGSGWALSFTAFSSIPVKSTESGEEIPLIQETEVPAGSLSFICISSTTKAHNSMEHNVLEIKMLLLVTALCSQYWFFCVHFLSQKLVMFRKQHKNTKNSQNKGSNTLNTGHHIFASFGWRQNYKIHALRHALNFLPLFKTMLIKSLVHCL